MARTFNGTSDYIDLSIGGMASVAAPFTCMAIVNRSAVGARAWASINTGTTRRSEFKFNGSSQEQWTLPGVNDAPITTLTVLDTSGWAVVGISKASGSAAPRGHRYLYNTTTWTHANSATSVANPTAGTSFRIGAIGTPADYFAGDIAVVGFWNRVLTDLETETLTTSLSAWLSLTPRTLFAFNQASTATAVTDSTANGSTQSAISGTTVSGSDPPGFNYALSSPATSGTIPMVSALTGSVTTLEPTSGTAPIVSVATGAPAAQLGVAGTVAVTTAASGTTNTLEPAAGSVAVVSATSGTANTLEPTSGSAAITAATSGAVTVLAPISGTVSVVSTASGAANIGGSLAAAGSVTIISGSAGAATVRTPAAGATPVTSTASGTATTRATAAGSVTVTTTVTGSVNVQPGGSLAAAGTITVTSTTTGATGQRSTVSATVAVVTASNGTVGQRSTVAAAVVIVSDSSGTVGRTTTAAGAVVILSGASGSPIVGALPPLVGRRLVATLRDATLTARLRTADSLSH